MTKVKIKGKQKSKPKQQSKPLCPTPVGMVRESENFLADMGRPLGSTGHLRILKIFAGGTVCTDVSAIGLLAGLLGPSCRLLAIFLSEIKHCKPQVGLHECTSRFVRDVFHRYLPEYTVHAVECPQVS